MRLLRTLILAFMSVIPGHSYAEPDVVINRLDYAKHIGFTHNGNVGLSVGTDSCNIGTTNLLWDVWPATTHPVITANLFRYHDGRLMQLGNSWVKHGFFATNASPCLDTPNRPDTCTAPQDSRSDRLYPGCTDLYPAGLNAANQYLGPRSKINPTSGLFDRNATDLSGYPSVEEIEKIMVTSPSELSVPGASYFIEGIYITNDDAKAKNSRNNVTYKKVLPTPSGFGWEFSDDPAVGMTHFHPIITELEKNGALISEIKTEEISGYESYVFVSSSVTEKNGTYQYEYVVYNFNSDLGIRSFALPVKSVTSGTIGSHMPKFYGEIWKSNSWTAVQTSNSLSWSTTPYGTDPNASAIRWGIAQSFWFNSNKAPVRKTATLKWFKPFGQPSFTAAVFVPGE